MKYLLLIFTTFSLQILAMNPLGPSIKPNTDSLEPSISEFGFSLFKELNKNKKNVIYSPFSIASSLFVLSYGSRNSTKEEIRKILNLDLSEEKLPLAYNRLYTDLFISENPCDFLLANIVFIGADTLILPTFKKPAIADFHVKFEKGSFGKDKKSDINKINKYVASLTEFDIVNILSNSDISDNTRLLLINTLFMKGAWKNPFNISETEPGSFFSSNGEITIYKMRQTAEFLYNESKDFQSIALPIDCKNSKTDVNMLILRPKSKNVQISNESFKQILNNLEYRYLNLEMPRFSLSQKYPLKKSLEELGLVKAFKRTANFSKINDRLDLYLNNIIHESVLKVDENGINIKDEDIKVDEDKIDSNQKNIFFNVNSPFYIIICDLKSKMILFIGKIQRPYEFI